MVNNIVYFGRIIATILLIRLISLIRLIRLICLIANRLFSIPPSLQGRAGERPPPPLILILHQLAIAALLYLLVAETARLVDFIL